MDWWPMPTANARKGAETERKVAAYFREQGFWMADRRLREGRADDQGDIDGIPYTTVQVKYVEANRYQAWVLDTLRQRDTAGTPLCLLVRRVPRKPVEQWEALLPANLLFADFEYFDGRPAIESEYLNESEAWTWLRMDLQLAMVILKRVTRVLGTMAAVEKELSYDRYSSDPYSSITSTASSTKRLGSGESSSAPSTEKDTPPSPTT